MGARRLGIGGKYILLVSLSAAAFIAAALLVSRGLLRDYALSSADELAGAVLDLADERFARFFEEMENVAEGLAGVRAVREADPEGMRDLFLATVRARRPYLRGVYLGTPEGAMHEWGEGEGFSDNVPSFPPGYDPRERPWYRTAIARDGFSVSRPYEFASVGAIGITCVLPVRREDGSLVGVLGLDILLEGLTSVLEGLKIPKGGKALLLSEDGGVIASQYPGGAGGRRSLGSFEAGGGSSLLGEREGSFVGEYGGTATQFVHRRVEGLGWIVVVGMPLDSVMEPVSSLLDLLGAVGLFLMAFLLAVLVAITGRLVVAPLGHIVSVVNRIEAGDRGARASLRLGGEFGLLCDELNKLADAVEENSRDLEEKARLRGEESSRLQRENTQLRIVEERQRIYRDMHDSIGARLTNVFFCNGVARELAREIAKGGAKELRDMHERIESNCLEAIQDLKEIILGMGEGEGPAPEFPRRLAEGIRKRLGAAGIRLDCRIGSREELAALGSGPRGELERLFDELVSNVLKHSGASVARLRMKVSDGRLSVSFADDGRGFDPDAAEGSGSGSGLRNIRYRVEGLGGSLRLQAAAGAGAAYSIEIPLKEARHA